MPPKPVKVPAGWDNLPDLSRLSLEEIEQLIAQKRLERSRNMLRNVRAQAQTGNSVQPVQPPEIPLPPPDLEPVQPFNKPVPTFRAENRANLDEPTTRFRPVELAPANEKKKPRKTAKSGRWRDVIGWTLEGLVILAVLIVVGNFILQQFGLSLDVFGGGIKVDNKAVSPARAEGPLLEVAANGSIAVPPTPTATPAPTVTPTNAPVISEAKPATPLPTVPPTPTPIIAPTPVPFVVQAVAEQPKTEKNKFSPPNRIVIPKIGLDAAITEVTINLGTWQVADYAVGHHQGTANAGDSSNMVLAGHRDVRGSIFLRLDELRIGDEFSVFSATGQYRYIVNNVLEVDPSEISVMNPTLDGTATLITCTPIGIASKRLIVKARLVK